MSTIREQIEDTISGYPVALEHLFFTYNGVEYSFEAREGFPNPYVSWDVPVPPPEVKEFIEEMVKNSEHVEHLTY